MIVNNFVLFVIFCELAIEVFSGFRKANVLGKVVIPRLNVTTDYINSELEEKEREEVFRLKRVKQKKDFDKKQEENKRRQDSADRKALEQGILPDDKEDAKKPSPTPAAPSPKDSS
ncbi:unnamed protein product [Danaus chrysippus]|uniref:(African queen) hypothetical protein n=1 Tax=Danaus chrysippus TaxID=151541 RepID=A0A8J2R7U6_9NEOP|nr:unnamed protein product [Danaus chrysippus]